MKKQKTILACLIGSLSIIWVGLLACLIAEVLAGYVFWILFGLDSILLLIVIFAFYKKIKKEKKQPSIEDTFGTEKTPGASMIDLYEILGIPVQYNKDGTIKDIYELLGLVPEFDEEGRRIPTVYEQLGFAPKFDQEGNEVPIVFVIKNKVGQIAKVDLTSRVLTRKISEKEKEEQIIKETLMKKLGEAQKTGDKVQEQNIKRVLATPKPKAAEKKKEAKKSDSKSAVIFKVSPPAKKGTGQATVGGAVSKVGLVKSMTPVLSGIFMAVANRPKNQARVTAAQPPQPPKPQQPFGAIPKVPMPATPTPAPAPPKPPRKPPTRVKPFDPGLVGLTVPIEPKPLKKNIFSVDLADPERDPEDLPDDSLNVPIKKKGSGKAVSIDVGPSLE